MKRLIMATALLAAACSPGEVADSTTTTAPPATSSTSGPTTSTSASGSSTTTAPATTSTTVVTTTTSPLLSGKWAEQPLVTTDFGALGWWDGSKWIGAQIPGSLPVVGGEDYQVTRMGFLGRTTGGAEGPACEPLDLIGVELDDPTMLGSFPGPYGVAVSAPWVLQPHLVEELADDGTYSGFASDLLVERGLPVAAPVIKQLIRTDLEGDGVNEVIVVAEKVNPSYLMDDGDYSIAFLRKVVEGEVRTAILGENIVTGEGYYGGAYVIGGVADLSGDGKMEIILNSAYFEGFGVSIFEYVNDDLGPVEVLDIGCGS